VIRSALARLRHSRAIGLVRYHVYRDVLLAYPRRHSCNICGWRGRRFLTFVWRNVLCPKCGSQIRHRLLAAALAHHAVGQRTPASGARILHISPEYCLGLVFRPRARQYVRADWATDDCDVRQDITRMPFASGIFDVVLACDTLEHIVDDRAALAECRRVLRPGGVAILTVPQSDENATYEDRTITTEALRIQEFGQHDHVRNYGTDFGQRVADAGFQVTWIDASSFDPALVVRHVLRPPVPLRLKHGWNNRRVYFAERA
jgi:SAM-dependent methyltransferase